MARNESDREDLIKDATAYTTRAEFTLSSSATVFVGIRCDDVVAIYFDQDPMYQFDSDGRIRRALVDGVLFRAQGTTLSRLSRQRNEHETVLARTDLSSSQLMSFTESMDAEIRVLMKEIDNTSAAITRMVPADGTGVFAQQVTQRLRAVLNVSPRVSLPINATR